MKYKRLLTSFMTAALITGSIAPQVMAANFADINDVPWEGAKTYINSVADAGLMVGDYNDKGEKVFRAKDKVSYCETMQLVYSLVKSYTGKEVDSSVVTKYTTVMSGYKIPSWAYNCVAYGLENGIVTISDIPGFINSSGASVNATRQDVAIMMGRALKDFDTVNNNATLSFKDASSVASIAVPYVDLLNRLGIITGDDNGNFNPKNYINRAEMAVIVSKTNDYIKQKMQEEAQKEEESKTSSVTGTVKSAETVGGNIVLTVDTGSSTMSFSGATYLSCLSGSKVITLSDVVVGDKVLVSYNGQNIKSVVVTEPAKSESNSSTQNQTSVKGTFSDLTKSYITVKVDGTKKEYELYDSKYVKFYYDGDSYDYDEFKDHVSSGDSVLVYFDSDGYVIKVQATEGDKEDDDYDHTGYFDKITSSYIRLKKSKSSSSTTDYDFKNDDRDNVTFYIGSKEKKYDDFYDEVEDNSKIGLMTNSSDEVTEVYLLDDDDDSDYDKEGYFYKLSDEYIRITSKKDSSSYDEYEFKNKDSDDVTFYVDGKERDYDYFDDKSEKGYKIGLVLNSDKKVTKVYMTTDDDDDDDYDKTGYLYKISSSYIRLMDNKSDSDYDDEYEYKNSDSDDVTFHIDGKERDYDYFYDKVSKKDKIGIKLNSSKKVTDVYLISSSSSSTDEVDGEIKSISSTTVKIQGSSSNYRVDDADDIDVDVKDGTDTIDDYDDLVDAINDDDKNAEITLEYDDDNYIVSIEGYISGGKGLLSSINTSNKTIEIEFDSGTDTKYDYKSSMKVDLRYYTSDVDGLEKAINGEKKSDREVKITVDKNGYITKIESSKI